VPPLLAAALCRGIVLFCGLVDCREKASTGKETRRPFSGAARTNTHNNMGGNPVRATGKRLQKSVQPLLLGLVFMEPVLGFGQVTVEIRQHRPGKCLKLFIRLFEFDLLLDLLDLGDYEGDP